MLAGLEEDGLVGAALIKAAAAAKEEYEMELRDLLEEATAAVDALREQVRRQHQSRLLRSQSSLQLRPHRRLRHLSPPSTICSACLSLLRPRRRLRKCRWRAIAAIIRIRLATCCRRNSQ